jgi:hypothetical protein
LFVGLLIGILFRLVGAPIAIGAGLGVYLIRARGRLKRAF